MRPRRGPLHRDGLMSPRAAQPRHVALSQGPRTGCSQLLRRAAPCCFRASPGAGLSLAQRMRPDLRPAPSLGTPTPQPPLPHTHVPATAHRCEPAPGLGLVIHILWWQRGQREAQVERAQVWACILCPECSPAHTPLLQAWGGVVRHQVQAAAHPGGHGVGAEGAVHGRAVVVPGRGGPLPDMWLLPRGASGG